MLLYLGNLSSAMQSLSINVAVHCLFYEKYKYLSRLSLWLSTLKDVEPHQATRLDYASTQGFIQRAAQRLER